MANTLLTLQISYPPSNKSPIVGGTSPNSGNQRLSFFNVCRFIMGMLTGVKSGLGASYLQYQTGVVAASATATCAAVVNADSVTIGGQAITAAQRRATGTLTCVSAIAGNTITINGVTFTGAAGAVVLGEATFSIDTSDTATATSITAQVNAYASPLLSGLLKAKSAAGVVTIYALTQGTAGNAITLATTGGTITRSAATLANGAAIANNTFDFAATNALTGDALAYAINNSTTAAIKQVTAVSDGAGVVTVTSKVGGIAGNGITFTSNNGTRLAVTGSGFLASGAADAVVRLTV